MGLGHSPRIVTDGLVLALDAQNSKSWKSGTTWTDTFGGNNGTLTGGTSHSDGPFPEAGYVEFDGSTEYLSIADSADLRLGTGTFTIEAWIYPHTVSPTYNSSIVVKGSSSAAATWQFDISNSSKLRFQYDASSSISSSSSLVANVWTHVAVVREGTGTNETKLYINGVLDTTGTVASDFSTTDTMKIGRNRGGGTVTYYNGYISNLRIIKGTALYTSDFTPPSSPLTAVTNTTLLCCQGGTNVDASPSAHSFQVIIGVPTLTSVGPSATKYFEFDGTDDYVNAPVTKAASCTFSCWAKSTNVNGKMLFNAGGSGPDLFFYNSNVSWNTFDGDDNAFASTPASATDGNWHYYVVVNDASSNAKLYYDGELLGTATYRNASANTNLTIGGSTSTYQWNGSISSFQLHNKVLTAAEVEQNYNATKGRYV
jgi:hypothetical protein